MEGIPDKSPDIRDGSVCVCSGRCLALPTCVGCCRPRTSRKVIVLRLTLDSSEPLEDAMRVLGALYGVTLVVSPEDQDGTRPARKTASTPGKKSANKPAGNKKTVNRASVAKKARPVMPSTKTAASRPEQKTVRRSVGASSNAEVRSWARRNGLAVSDRGRLPASVVAAYRNAQNA